MTRTWVVDGFDPEAWKKIRETIQMKNYINGSDYFGAIMCGAVCFDIVLRDVGDTDGIEWLLCADPYILGIDSGYGYTRNRETPYDEYDGFALEFCRHMTFEDALRSFIEQIDDFTAKDVTLSAHADRTDIAWKDDMGI